MIKKICICGGGSLGHVVAGYIASKKEYEVSILTSKPDLWNDELIIKDCNKNIIKGKLKKVTNNPIDVIPDTDFIIICLPGMHIKKQLTTISPFVSKNSIVGSIVSSTGFYFLAQEILPPNTKLLGFQRVPFICRTEEYGKSANLLGYKKELNIAISNLVENDISSEIENMFDTKTNILSDFMEVTISNSNPIIHPVRLYSLFKDYNKDYIYSREFLFYEDWDEETSELLIACDKEFMQIVSVLNLKTIVPLLDYYESFDAKSITKKIKSIEAFKKIKAPMIKKNNGFIPDFNHRYFTEDFDYGLSIVKSMAKKLNIKTPNIDNILQWGENRNYL